MNRYLTRRQLEERETKARQALRQRGAHVWMKRRRDRQGIMRDAGFWLDGCWIGNLGDPYRACVDAGIPIDNLEDP